MAVEERQLIAAVVQPHEVAARMHQPQHELPGLAPDDGQAASQTQATGSGLRVVISEQLGGSTSERRVQQRRFRRRRGAE